DFPARLKEVIQTFPPIAHEGSTTSGRLKQPAGRTIPHIRHGSTRDAQGEIRRTIKSRMAGWRYMTHKPDIRKPRKVFWILRASNDKLLFAAATSRFQEQFLQHGLPVGGVCPQIRKIAAVLLVRFYRVMESWIDASIKRRYLSRSQPITLLVERWATGITQHEVERFQAIFRQVIDLHASPQTFQSHGSIQIVKNLHC